MLKYLAFLLCMFLAPVIYGAGIAFETIAVATSTAKRANAVSSEIVKTVYDNYPYVSGIYYFTSAGSPTLRIRFDAGTATATKGIPIATNGSFKLTNITDMRNLTFIASGAVGTLTATYSVSRKDDNY